MATTAPLSSDRSAWTALRQELDTAWAPDPWRFDGMNQWPIAEDVHVDALEVPFVGNRIRTVPLLSPGLHVRLDRAVSELSARLDSTLAKTVCGYRPDGDGHWTHYRNELKRRFALEDTFAARSKVVARVDLKRFFPSIQMHHLDRLFSSADDPDACEVVLSGLSLVESKVGHLVPEGYSFSRALASLTLSDLDQSISRPFVRWLDDYTIFGDTYDEVAQAVETLASEAQRLGFKLNNKKTRIYRSENLTKYRSGSLIDMHSSGDLAALSISPGSSERAVRYALRVGAQNQDSRLLTALEVMIDDLSESTYPRLAWYLSSMISHSESTRLIEYLVETRSELQDWALLRLSPVLWYAPTLVAESTLERLTKGAWRNAALIPIVARVLAKKRPALLSLLPDPTSPTIARAYSLAREEANRDNPRNSGVDLSTGPPVLSYL